MKVAAWQSPLGVSDPAEVVARLQIQVARCEEAGVEVLCCPETVLGGLADGSPDPGRHAFGPEALLEVLAPAASVSVTMIVGTTERGADGRLYNSAAVVRGGELLGWYRKVYPGDRSAYAPGEELPVFTLGPSGARCGIIVCNDVYYVEPARVLAERGAAVLFVPTYGAHRPEKYARLRARGNHLLVARAVENRLTVVAADVAGRDGRDGRISEGVTAVIDRDGTVLAKATPFEEDLLIVDVPAERPPPDPRGWDGARNPAVANAFLSLWKPMVFLALGCASPSPPDPPLPPPLPLLSACMFHDLRETEQAMGSDRTLTLIVHLAATDVFLLAEPDGTLEVRTWDARGWPVFHRTSAPTRSPTLKEVVGTLDALLPSAPDCPMYGTDGATGQGIGFVWRTPDRLANLYFGGSGFYGLPEPEELPEPLGRVVLTWPQTAGTPSSADVIEVVEFRTRYPMGLSSECDTAASVSLELTPTPMRLSRSVVESTGPEGCASRPGAPRVPLRLGLYPVSSHTRVVTSFEPYTVAHPRYQDWP